MSEIRAIETVYEEARRYHALLGVAADALEWTEKESDGASKAA